MRSHTQHIDKDKVVNHMMRIFSINKYHIDGTDGRTFKHTNIVIEWWYKPCLVLRWLNGSYTYLLVLRFFNWWVGLSQHWEVRIYLPIQWPNLRLHSVLVLDNCLSICLEMHLMHRHPYTQVLFTFIWFATLSHTNVVWNKRNHEHYAISIYMATY